jgi:hypothetical protein
MVRLKMANKRHHLGHVVYGHGYQNSDQKAEEQ